MITENGGSIVNSNPWGLKSLAYPIQKKTTGIYWVLEYQAASDFNEKFKVQMLRDDTLMRFMVSKLDKHAVEHAENKRNGVFDKTNKIEA